MRHKLPKNSNYSYYVALIISYLIWSAAGPVIKLTLSSVPPFTFLFLRFLIVGIVLLPYTFYLLKKETIHNRDIGKIIILGIFSQTSLIFIFLGYKYTTALEATTIGVLGPILSVAAGHYFYHEKIDIKVKVGLLIASLGTLFVALEPILEPSGNAHATELRLIGNAFVILYSLFFLLYIIWSKISFGQNNTIVKKALHFVHIKPMVKRYSPILLTALSFYVGLVSFIPMFILELKGVFGEVSFSFDQLTLIPIMGIFYMALISSIIAYFLFEWSLTKVEVKDTAIFSYLQPLFTLPFAYLLLRETPNEYLITGSIIIAIGVVIAERKKS